MRNGESDSQGVRISKQEIVLMTTISNPSRNLLDADCVCVSVVKTCLYSYPSRLAFSTLTCRLSEHKLHSLLFTSRH